VLSCYIYRRRLGPYLDGSLEPTSAERVRRHVAACDRCRRDAEQLRRLRAALRDIAALVTPPDWTGFWPGVVRGIQDARVPVAVPARRRGWAAAWRPRLALGGVAVALALSLTLWQLFGRPPAQAAAMVVSAHTEAPDGTVMVYSTPEHDMAVVWVFGVD
jgi:anti-sigma factor RsiW